jgi:predicted dehydrogenase
MRLALIGCTGHWTSYAPALKAIPGLTLAAVATASQEEALGQFDRAPGVTVDTRRYTDVTKLLETEKLDFVQVSCRSDKTAPYIRQCLQRKLPVVAEKPLAMDLASLETLWRESSDQVPVIPMHTMRSEGWVHAAKQVVAGGAIGQPMVSFHQKSYKWGRSRPDWFRMRCTFAGLAPYIGIHAFDWLVWILGGKWDEISGWESAAARPDYPACASQAGFVLRGADGQVATVSLDYLRPESAPTHGDERLRIAGSDGLLDLGAQAGLNLLVRGKSPPETLTTPVVEDWFVRFVRAIRGEGTHLVDRASAFRATEISLKAQLAADTGKSQSLTGTIYR